MIRLYKELPDVEMQSVPIPLLVRLFSGRWSITHRLEPMPAPPDIGIKRDDLGIAIGLQVNTAAMRSLVPALRAIEVDCAVYTTDGTTYV